MKASRASGKVAALLFGSGFCALIYQVAWLREFRLIFGASTAASAAVVAIFISGLGLGGILFGRRADRHPRPLQLYANLETLIALSAAASPFLLLLARALYVQLGGTLVLGLALGTLTRLMLASSVLLVPTLLMGGTLPAAARAVETHEDVRRQSVAALYGLNTLGAVAGCLTANFFLLETFGTRSTLWTAACINLLIALVARNLARSLPSAEPVFSSDSAPVPAVAPQGFVVLAAAVVGFAFFLMELVWYRMLSPLLGGTIFSFGLILAVALLGIGSGSVFYMLARNRSVTLRGFGYTCLLEAFFLALPLALGDRLAILTLLLRPLGFLGFAGFAASWSVVALLVVFPAAFVAGAQFPLLIALLGSGRENVGRQVGLVYFANTVGGILGSLAGGFGLLPLLSAPGCWRFTAGLLLGLSIGAFTVSHRGHRWSGRLVPAGIGLAVIGLLMPAGPTAVWRHSGIGIGRVPLETVKNAEERRQFINATRHSIIWEAEGVESSVALHSASGLAFALNGRIDGNAILDAPTQVMAGLLGAILHPAPRRSLVIGLGTGSTAGWLADVAGMERVDVVELEPAILHVAQACASVNQQALRNPKVHITIADAREILLTTPARYDIIFSEPSNPFRAGIASLFTREYYRAISTRLEPGGLFIQWVQAYEVDPQTIRTVYATLASVFPCVETWQLGRGDLALIASRSPTRIDVMALRKRLREEPFAHALASSWRAADLEGFLGHYVARRSFALAIAGLGQAVVNTDDRNSIEFGFARSVGREGRFEVNDLRAVSRARQEDRPEVGGGEVDWARVEEERLAIDTMANSFPPPRLDLTPDQQHRVRAQRELVRGNAARALDEWRSQPREPSGPREISLVAQILAEAADEEATRYLDALRAFQPAEADAILGRLRLREGRLAEAADALEAAFRRHRSDPWPSQLVMKDALLSADEIARHDNTLALRLFRIIEQPFSTMSLEGFRTQIGLALAFRLDRQQVCLDALRPLEPHVPWDLPVLSWRRSCYRDAHLPEAQRAEHELDEYLAQRSVPFGEYLVPTGPK